MHITEKKTKKFFEHFGLKVQKLKSNNKKIADFLGHSPDGSKYIIEVKSRDTDTNFYNDLNKYGEASREDDVGKSNVASRKIRKATNQIQSSIEIDDQMKYFRIISFVSLQENSDIDTNQFRSTLYGIKTLIVPDDKGDAKSIPCAYFDYSDFYRYPLLDGVILLTNRWAQLCPNPFSEHINDFESSHIYKKLSSNGAVFLPKDAEETGLLYIADCDIERSNEKQLIHFIKNKYQLETDPIVVEPKHIEHAVKLDKKKFL